MKMEDTARLFTPVGHPFTYTDLQDHYNNNFKQDDNDQIITDNWSNFDGFLDSVNDYICDNFDANEGINWGFINEAINETLTI